MINLENKILVTVAICTYNRAKFLSGALNSLKTQNFSKNNFEVLIVDNNSNDETGLIANNFINENKNLNVRYVIENQQGLSFARNRSIAEAKGEIISFIDDDAIAQNDFITSLYQSFQNLPQADAIGGKVIPIYSTKEEPNWLSKYIWGLVTKVDFGNQTKEFPANKYPSGCNMNFRKKVFAETGVFNTDLKLRSDDKDIFYKLKKQNKIVYYVPSLLVHHNIDDYRLEYSFIKKLCLTIGTSERIRIKNDGSFALLKKFIEYIFKFFASFFLAASFMLKNEKEKAKYIIVVRWYILKGLFKTNV